MSALFTSGLLVYIAVCFAVGWYTRDTRAGMWGGAAISFFLTPLVGLLIALLLDQHEQKET